MKEIPLTKGYVALVDDEDYDCAMSFKWKALVTTSTVYAMRQTSQARGKKKKYILLHRFLMGVDDRGVVDHHNHDGLDCQKHNLRVCPKGQRDNNANNRKTKSPTSSRFKGVSWNRRDKAWHARIMVNYRRIGLGYFRVEEDAARAYDTAAKQFFGDFAHPNFAP